MKFVLAFVGTLCLMGGIHAQISNVATTVASAISTSMADLTSTLQCLNSTVVTADQTISDALNAFGQDLIALYNSYYTKYQDYTTMDLSQISSAISNIQSYLTNPPQLLQDDTSYVQQIFTDAQMYADQIQDALNNAVMNMNAGCGTTCATTKAIRCANKFGKQLTSRKVTIDRVTKCIDPEATRFTELGNDIASQYATFLTMASNYLQLDDMCDIPAAADLNNPSPTAMGPPSTECFKNYLQRFSNVPTHFYNADSLRWAQLPLISYRSKRCFKLVALDVQDRINEILAKYAACL